MLALSFHKHFEELRHKLELHEAFINEMAGCSFQNPIEIIKSLIQDIKGREPQDVQVNDLESKNKQIENKLIHLNRILEQLSVDDNSVLKNAVQTQKNILKELQELYENYGQQFSEIYSDFGGDEDNAFLAIAGSNCCAHHCR